MTCENVRGIVFTACFFNLSVIFFLFPQLLLKIDFFFFFFFKQKGKFTVFQGTLEDDCSKASLDLLSVPLYFMLLRPGGHTIFWRSPYCTLMWLCETKRVPPQWQWRTNKNLTFVAPKNLIAWIKLIHTSASQTFTRDPFWHPPSLLK